MDVMKRAEGLSLTTIVVAALALLVLIVLSVIFVGKMGKYEDTRKDCERTGGVCYGVDTGATCRDHGENMVSSVEGQCFKSERNADGSRDVDDTKVCCVRIGSA